VTRLVATRTALVTHIRRTYCSDGGRPIETADIVVPAAHCEIVYEIPINRP
jgi:GntR family transcriptional regulator